MKSKLTVFFAGFAAGLLAMCLAIGLMADDPRMQSPVAMPVVQSNTNLLEPIHWKQTRVLWHLPRSNSAR
jgi:hypothetical protein